MVPSSMIIPVYGEGFFHIGKEVIYYTIVFDYIDKSGYYYWEILDPKKRRKEEVTLARNMQKMMDEERVVINGKDVRAIVNEALLEIRGSKKRHSVVFHVTMEYDEVKGANVYENFYEPTTAEYDYTVYWIAPPGGKLINVESEGRIEFFNNKRIAKIFVKKGTELSGYESVIFEMKRY